MDNKKLYKIIKQQIWSELKAVGFTQFSSNNAWRFSDTCIELIEVKPLGKQLCWKFNVPQWSLGVSSNIYYYCIPLAEKSPLKEKDGHLLVYDYDCHLRNHLHRTLEQHESKRTDIWVINEDGSNVDCVIEDVKNVILKDGLEWFNKYSVLENAHYTILNEEENIFGTFGFGRKNSPVRNYMSGYLSLAIGQYEVAKDFMIKSLGCDLYSHVHDSLQESLDFIESKLKDE